MKEHQHTTFMQVGEFVENFGGNELEHTDDLLNRSFVIHFENSWVIHYDFKPDNQIEWSIQEGAASYPAKQEKDLDWYRATCLREGYYLIDFVKRSDQRTTVTLLIDMVQKIATLVLAEMPTREETYKPVFERVLDKELLTPVHSTITHGSIDTSFSGVTATHKPTDDLIGKRVHYQYGPGDSYEHIYLSREYYTWNCIQGPEAGLADTDYCQYFKIAEELYLFIWLEKVIPTIGVVLLDFKQAKTTGKIFGYQGDDFVTTCNTPVGAFLTLKNETRYDNAGC
jgi:hypothetical protein